MNNLIVYCEIEDGIIADVSLELLTKGRSLANQLNCKLEALVIGSNLDGVEKQVFPYGADTVYTVAEDTDVILPEPGAGAAGDYRRPHRCGGARGVHHPGGLHPEQRHRQ